LGCCDITNWSNEMNFLALTKYGPLGASSRVRTLQYVPHLQAAGLDVTVRPLLDDAYLARRYAGQGSGLAFILRAYLTRVGEAFRARRYDLVWIEKEMMPWVPGLVERGLLAGTPYVLDYDDAVFHTYDRHPNPAVRRLMGRKIDRVMRGATLVVAGNDYLAERARSAGAERVEVVPSVIDLERYRPVTPPPDGPFTIGWIGSPGSERLLEHVREVLAEAVREPDTRLVLVGASERALQGVPHETWTWREEVEVEQMRRFHVGIMPLADTPWERGKCGFKLIQCMGAGRAVIASPVGVNADIVKEGEAGFLASTPDDWRRAFETLREDRERAARMGRAGRHVVEQQYDLAVTAPRLAELLRAVVGAPVSSARSADVVCVQEER
jgi:glycosyltransferase involved in cell wall biosynthesis